MTNLDSDEPPLEGDAGEQLPEGAIDTTVHMPKRGDADADADDGSSLIGKHLSRYRILDKLGRGGMGVVYKAFDTELDRPVALKVLSGDGARDAESRERLHREARAAAALAHPNICKIFDIGEHEGAPFIVMELIHGHSLGEKMTTEPRPISELVSIGKQIAGALAAAHARGIVHRDIKPENILITAENTPIVLDFGLAKFETPRSPGEASKHVAPDSLTSFGQVLGTIGFMSPEQAEGETVDTSTDIFSLAILLYKMATGRYPFTGASRVAMMNSIVSVDPVAPATIVPTIPWELDSLLLRMLRKQPYLRPSAATVALVLDGVSARAGSTPAAAEPAPEIAKRHRPVVGREAELATLIAAYEKIAAPNSMGQMFCVTGEAGIGKTTLVDAFLEEVASGDAAGAVARGRCSERLDGAEAFLPILEALDDLVRNGGSAAQHLRLLAPAWNARILEVDPHGTPTQQAAAQVTPASAEQMKRELTTFFQTVSRLRPVILFIENVHWADASTTDLLAYLAGRFDAIRLMIVVTYRPAELRQDGHPFLKVKMELEAKGVATEIPLPFLGSEHLESYLDLEFPGHAFPKAFAKLIHARTEGNPLFMLDLVQYLRDRGALSEVDGHWALTVALKDLAVEIPLSVRRLIELKMERLESSDHRLLTTASIQGRKCDSAVIASALGADPADVEERLQTLEKTHDFVKLLGEDELPDGTITVRYQFVHALYQNAFFDSLAPSRRSSLSASVAAALRRFHGDLNLDVAPELALLYEDARDFAHATVYFQLAAQENLRIHAYREAADLARRGLKLVANLSGEAEAIEREFELQSILGPALMAIMGFTAPEVEVAFSRIGELSHRATGRPRVFMALCGLWQYHLFKGELQRALGEADELLKLATEIGAPDALAEAHRAKGESLVWMGNVTSGQEFLERGIANSRGATPARHTAGLPPVVACHAFQTWSLLARGFPDQAVQSSLRSIELAKDHPFGLAFAQDCAAMLHYFLNQPGVALEHATKAIELSVEHGFVFWQAVGTAAQGWALARTGEDTGKIENIRQVFEFTKGAGVRLGLSWVLIMLADVTRIEGAAEDALEVIEEGQTWMETVGDELFLPDLLRLKGELLLAVSAEKAPDAEKCFRRAIEVSRQQRAPWWELRPAIGLAKLLRDQGRTRDARRTLAGIHKSFSEGFDTPPMVEARKLLEDLG